MLSFLFGSTMFLIMLGSLAMMYALKRHRRFRKFTKWMVFLCAFMAGAAAALSFVGEWAGALLVGFVTYVLGAPAGAVGILAIFVAVGILADLLDGVPDGFAQSAILALPSLLAVTGGALGLYGGQATGAVSQAGAYLLGSLIGLG